MYLLLSNIPTQKHTSEEKKKAHNVEKQNKGARPLFHSNLLKIKENKEKEKKYKSIKYLRTPLNKYNNNS